MPKLLLDTKHLLMLDNNPTLLLPVDCCITMNVDARLLHQNLILQSGGKGNGGLIRKNDQNITEGYPFLSS